VSGFCAAGQSIRSINEDGTIGACEVDTDTNTNTQCDTVNCGTINIDGIQDTDGTAISFNNEDIDNIGTIIATSSADNALNIQGGIILGQNQNNNNRIRFRGENLGGSSSAVDLMLVPVACGGTCDAACQSAGTGAGFAGGACMGAFDSNLNVAVACSSVAGSFAFCLLSES